MNLRNFGMSDKSFKNCGWANKHKVRGWFCKNKRWWMADHDIGTGLCPCREWVIVKSGNKLVAREWTQPKLFD